MDLGAEKIINYNLFSENNDLFISSFCENFFLKKQIVIRYSDGVSKWKKRMNSGSVRYDDKVKKHYSGIYNLNFNDIMAVYIEKKRKKHAVFLYEGKVIISGMHCNVEGFQFEANTLKWEGKEINLITTEELKNLIVDLQKIVELENVEKDVHLVRNAEYSQREKYIKLLLIFCAIHKGISAKQLLHLVSIAKQFEISSKALLGLFKVIFEARISDLYLALEQLKESIVSKDELLIDMMVLCEIGSYEEIEKQKIRRNLSAIMNVEQTVCYKYSYYLEKEIGV